VSITTGRYDPSRSHRGRRVARGHGQLPEGQHSAGASAQRVDRRRDSRPARRARGERSMAKKARAPRRKKAAAGSVGLTASETATVDAGDLRDLTKAIDNDGGVVLGSYRDPFGATPVLLVALPIERVEPTPYQRDPSDAHVKRLVTVIDKVGR